MKVNQIVLNLFKRTDIYIRPIIGPQRKQAIVIVSNRNRIRYAELEKSNKTASGHLTVLGDGLTVNESSTTELEVVGNITASGALFANLPFDSDAVTDGVVVCDTEDGKFYLTGSQGGGGGVGTTVVANLGIS